MYVTRKVGPKGQVVIPEELRNQHGIAPGTPVYFDTDGERIIIRRQKDPAQAVQDFLKVRESAPNLAKISSPRKIRELMRSEVAKKYGLH